MASSGKGALRIGFLGAGGMGRIHAARLLKLKGPQIVGICSKPLEFAEKMNYEIVSGKAACYENFDRMLAEVPMDALYVCIPPFAHHGQVEAAARQGISVFLEKPLSLKADQARRMVAAIEKAKVASLVGYHMRTAEPVRKLKQMIADGSAGRPTLFVGSFMCNAWHGEWWRDVKRCGGQVLEQAIHVYDLALHLFGPVQAVSGRAANLLHKKVPFYTVEDTSGSLLQFKNGAIGTITASNCAIPTQWQSSFRVVCENVTVDFTSPTEAIFWHTKGRNAEVIWKTGKTVEPQTVKSEEDLYLNESRHFLKVLAGKEKSCTPARDGLTSLQVCEAVLTSAKAGGKVITLK